MRASLDMVTASLLPPACRLSFCGLAGPNTLPEHEASWSERRRCKLFLADFVLCSLGSADGCGGGCVSGKRGIVAVSVFAQSGMMNLRLDGRGALGCVIRDLGGELWLSLLQVDGPGSDIQ